MFSTKQDIDRHVKTSLAKLSEAERKSKGFTIAKYYARVCEYQSAANWLHMFLEVREDNAAALKLLAQCYERQNKAEKALQYYQRSLQADPRQPNLIKDVCNLLLNNGEPFMTKSRIKYWVELADKEHIVDNATLELRLKLTEKDGNKVIENVLMQQIHAHPTDISLRIRLVKYLVDNNRQLEAFKHCFDIEMKFIEAFAVSLEWYNAVSSVLVRYADSDKAHVTSWDYWLLTVWVMERQISLQLATEGTLSTANKMQVKDLERLLFDFDQLLKKVSDFVMTICPERELAAQFLAHYRGQFLLHAASLLFKAEKTHERSQWRATTKKSLPLLLLAYQCGTADIHEVWYRKMSEQNRIIVNLWHQEGAFRCVQAGQTILSCICDEKENSVIAQIRQVTNNRTWICEEDIVSQIKQVCVDPNWRKTIFRDLFTTGDQFTKVSTSYFMQTDANAEPIFEIPETSDIERYGEIARGLHFTSLQRQVYLNLTALATEVKSYGTELSFTTPNLQKCGPDTLNKLDLDSFLLCTVIQAKQILKTDKSHHEFYFDRPYDKPSILPVCNMTEVLCTADQDEWWAAVFALLDRRAGENLPKVRAIIQNGIEAIRGDGPAKVETIILLQVAKALSQRAQSAPHEEKRPLEDRADHLYRACIRREKQKQNFGDSRLLFKYVKKDEGTVTEELKDGIEDAIQFIAARFFKNSLYNECIDEFDGLDYPFAAYFRAEAFKKLDESGHASRKTRQMHVDKARQCLQQTLHFLEDAHYKNHPLQSIVPNEIHRLGGADTSSSNGLDGSFYDARDTSILSTRSVMRETSFTKNNELEDLIRRMMGVLEIMNKDVAGMKSDMSTLQAKMAKIEESVSQKPVPQQNGENDDYYAEDGRYHPNAPIADVGRRVAGAFNFDAYNTAFPMYMPQAFAQQAIVNASLRAGTSPLLPAPPVPPHPITIPPQCLAMSQMYAPAASVFTMPPGPVPPKKDIAEALQTSSILPAWNNAFPLQATPTPQESNEMPHNVVIKQSDPIPDVSSAPPTPAEQLFVTIPTQHLKKTYENITPPMMVQPQPQQKPPTAVIDKSKYRLPVISATYASSNASPLLATPPQTTLAGTPKPFVEPTPTSIPPQQFLPFSFSATPVSVSTPKAAPADKSSAANNVSSELLEEPAEYDPCPDFKPIIPLPDEVEVKTGEENEEIMFTNRAKLFRKVEKEWKERGLGALKILKSKIDGKYRVVMRRDQIHKLCANHYITADIELIPIKSAKNQFIYAAIDFSEGSPTPETFLVRFKEEETAQQFQKAFEDAKKADVVPVAPAKVAPAPVKVTPIAPPATTAAAAAAAPKTLFNMTSTNTSSIFNTANIATSKPSDASPFSSFTFGKQATDPAKPFGSLFGTLSTPAPKPALLSTPPTMGIFSVPPAAVPSKDSGMSKTSKEDDEADDFVPTATFQPVIELPDLVETVTGEENENVLFEHRAKLFRYDRTTKEWKERGLGNMKVLANKSDCSKVRLLMRREQVLKLCCNQYILEDMKFEKIDKPPMVRWHGPDYSENETQLEFLALRFKTQEIRDQFMDAVTMAQSNMKNVSESGAAKAPEKKVEEVKGWGDQFKAKTGTWACTGCYVSNSPDKLYCDCCNSPKDATVPKKEPSKGLLPAPTGSGFSFGIPNTTTTITAVAKAPEKKVEEGKGWGDKFKPATGSWTCQGCYVANTESNDYCQCCNAPKDDTVPKAPSLSNTSASAFSFGNTGNNSFSFGTAGGFTFGNAAQPATATTAAPAPQAQAENLTKSSSAFSFNTASTGFTFGNTPKVGETTTTTTTPGFSFGNIAASTAPSFGELAAKANGTANEQSTTNAEKPQFSFVFKPKSPGKAKSPGPKSPGVSGDEQTDDEYQEEENNTYFTPVVQLAPVDVKTGEEDEEVLYSHRAKLFRFDSDTKEWKERGIGDVKILKHRASGKLRILMRRDQIHKICLNHALTSEIEYNMKNENNWLFSVGDYSEGEVEFRSFLLRFKTGEIADQFKAAVDTALGLAATSLENGHTEDLTDDQKLALDLSLPKDFFDYKKLPDCKGCNGCDDNFVLPVSDSSVTSDDEIPLDFNVVRKLVKGQKPKRVSFSADVEGERKTQAEKQPISIFGGVKVPEEEKTPASSIFSSALNTIATPPVVSDGGSLFGSSTFGSAGTIGQKSIFGGAANVTSTTPSVFGSNSTFGSTFATFSFATAAKELTSESNGNINGTSTTESSDANGNNEQNGNDAAATFWKHESASFASLAENASTNAFNAKANEGAGFFGLTKKDDIFTKLAKQKASGEGTADPDSSNANDEEYDPHYDPIIQLPDEIVVKTGEEDEEKKYGNRAKLYRYCADTKQWKERGVGELKILHHPERGTYRLLMRREQIYKLVLNHIIPADFSMSPMQSSTKAFVWAAMNYAEDQAELEKLAVRFGNENQAAEFKAAIDECLEAIKTHGPLEPEED